ncbi:MAG: LLM class flavin-dependent oxidoreductase [Chloroflexi bacterium]|nr:LLM class flavin-dependent oxidoreductase [Chloroflexota bacterium]MCH8195848.1 LLM class flavin-dependent oxidoreductase [Chloroflexota bacterium]MCI0768923.1 LLM class flavin-dependent oxidoreductase [Chloroflexota bacterium]
MDLSMIYELETSDGSDEGVRRVYRECIEQVKLADELGYRTVWFTEHHFLPKFSFSPAPEIFLAALARETKNIRLGHGIVLLPHRINHPLRVAERIAVLDLVSDGRVEFGGGRAISESEVTAFGVSPDDTRPQWEEALRMLPAMWTGDSFSWDSKTLPIPERSVVPKPVQKPHPPMWVACTQPATVEFAGSHGLGALAFGIGTGESNDYVRLYRDKIKTADPIGKFVNNRFALWVHTLCAPTDQEALDLQGPSYFTYSDYVKQLFAPWIDGKAPKSYEWFMDYFKENLEYMKTATMEDIVAAGSACIGSPETCLKVLQHVADAGVDEALLFMQSFDTPHDAIMRSIEMLAKEVKPKIKAPAVTA